MKISVLLFGNGSLNFKCPGMGVRTCLFGHLIGVIFCSEIN
jgi:hypothetical protein